MSETVGRWVAPDRTPKADIAPLRLQLFRGAKFDLQKISRKVNGLPAIRIDRDSGWQNPFLDESPIFGNSFTGPETSLKLKPYLLGY
jgi:hypothetical protein